MRPCLNWSLLVFHVHSWEKNMCFTSSVCFSFVTPEEVFGASTIFLIYIFIQLVCSERVPNLTLLASLLAYFGVCFWKAYMGITGTIIVWPISISVVEEGKIKVSSFCSSKRTAVKSFLPIISLFILVLIVYYLKISESLDSVRQLVIFSCRICELL